MAEAYSDEELAEVVRGYKQGALLGAVTAEALIASVLRLQGERDEARRVAAALGDYYLTGSTGVDGFESWDAANAAVAWHPAYRTEAEHD